MGKGDRMAKSYSISHCTFKWTKKLFFHLLDLAILNSYIPKSSCEGKKISHRFSIYPHEEYVGTCWTRTDNTREINVDLILNHTSLDSKSAAANIGLSHLRRS